MQLYVIYHGGIIKKVTPLLVGMQIAILSLVWAYPIYEIGGNFKGLDRNYAKTLTKKYVFQDTLYTKEKSSNPTEEVRQIVHFYSLFEGDNYLRLAGEDGKTLWKSFNLSIDGDIDFVSDMNENNEYFVNDYRSTAAGVILTDPKKKCHILKKFDGTEIVLPAYLNAYQPLDSRPYMYPDFPYKKVFWMRHGNEENRAASFALAIMNYDGIVESNLETDIPAFRINHYNFDLKYTRLLIDYDNETGPYGIRGLIICSLDGKLVKHYPNYDLGNVIRFDPKAPDYAITRENEYKNDIIRLKDGEIIAEIPSMKVDLCQSDSTLIALVSLSGTISLIDVLSGKLLQDFSDNKRNYKITFIRLSQDGKEFWYEETYQDKTRSIKHYRLEN